MADRKINWVSSTNDTNKQIISSLESQLSDFYSHAQDYYNDIDFTANNWIKNEPGYIDIAQVARNSKKILEVGCGSANILKHKTELEKKYYPLLLKKS